ncbi:type IV pilus twitching motility protein PilT [Microbacterium sp. HD4P20]|uniref:type IV pilus twitching motility protein PilT n=1 Tax=Microbacterium sp. HD4P20 TaxID=2864874 RepID=UPI0020A40036|nr:type IV pilus twitching motility protein PilT [Microbacterium sp. HD4P20]MCP2637168.1 type IV pilus twitching motility protein PilT [Microbacterium sp. HD4P20]
MTYDSTTLAGMLGVAGRAGASDVHLTANHPPLMRVKGDLTRIPGYEEPTGTNWLEAAVGGLMTTEQIAEFREHGEVDLSYSVPDVARFRVNVFRQLGDVAVALRFIADKALSLEQLGVPAVARDLVLRPRGLVLVTGPTGSGKSTTLSAMIDIVNRTLPAHIVTVEDPVEFQHTSRTALIHQREIGSDTRSFAEALRRVLRQDPDVILIGELRDPVSISTALSAAETGHLVLSTLHTQSAAKSINRIVDAFPPDQQTQVRTQLGDTLQGIMSQTLLPMAQSDGRVIATEVLINTPAIANLIREGQVSQIYSMLQAGGALGMHTLDQDLRRLVEDGSISMSLAKSYAADPSSLDDARVRPRDLDAESWTMHSGERQLMGWES